MKNNRAGKQNKDYISNGDELQTNKIVQPKVGPNYVLIVQSYVTVDLNSRTKRSK